MKSYGDQLLIEGINKLINGINDWNSIENFLSELYVTFEVPNANDFDDYTLELIKKLKNVSDGDSINKIEESKILIFDIINHNFLIK